MVAEAAKDPVNFANDVPEGVALQFIDETAMTNFITDTRAEVQYCIQYAEQLSKIVLDEEFKTADGVSMTAIIGAFEEIERDLKDIDPMGMVRMKRAITCFAASMNCPIPARFVLLDSVSHTAISMLASICNKLKDEELRKLAAAVSAGNAGVPEKSGQPEQPEPAMSLEDHLITGLAILADKAME